jgi:hypothetical protein
MNSLRWWVPVAAAALALTGCVTLSDTTTPRPVPPPTKGLPSLNAITGVRDTAYALADRATPAPAGYGLYSVVLARRIDRKSLRLVAEVLATTDEAGSAALPPANLNLMVIPVQRAEEARQALADARKQPDANAATLMQRHYDFGQAALLMARVCTASRGPAVLKACGGPAPEGPLLVTALRPLNEPPVPGEPLLVVNLSETRVEAVREVLSFYARQIQRPEFNVPDRVQVWRLEALSALLNGAEMLPSISKALASPR